MYLVGKETEAQLATQRLNISVVYWLLVQLESCFIHLDPKLYLYDVGSRQQDSGIQCYHLGGILSHLFDVYLLACAKCLL